MRDAYDFFFSLGPDAQLQGSAAFAPFSGASERCKLCRLCTSASVGWAWSAKSIAPSAPSLPGSSLVTPCCEGPPSPSCSRGGSLEVVGSQAGAWEPVASAEVGGAHPTPD